MSWDEKKKKRLKKKGGKKKRQKFTRMNTENTNPLLIEKSVAPNELAMAKGKNDKAKAELL